MLIRTIAILGIGVVTLGLINGQDTPRNNAAPNISADQVHREGSRLDQQPTQLRLENDQLFLQIGAEVNLIRVLENLAAQRIYRAHRDDPEDNKWVVSGIMTEFEGKNYLLLEQAVRIRQ